MRNYLLISLVFAAIKLTAQDTSTCKPSEPFTKVQLYDGIEITLERGDSYTLCPSPLTRLEDLSISLEDGTLRVRKVSGVKYDKAPQLKIIYKDLSVIEGYSKANIDAKNLIKGDSVKVELRSGATLYAGLDVKYLEAVIIEGCLFKADGYAISQKIDVATGGTFSGFELEGTEGDVKVTSGGKAKINIEKKLTATASTGGFINYRGTPVLDVKTSFGGKINHDTGK